jgi:hypothetical protein
MEINFHIDLVNGRIIFFDPQPAFPDRRQARLSNSAASQVIHSAHWEEQMELSSGANAFAHRNYDY